MKQAWILSGILIAMWLVLGGLLLIPSHQNARGHPHIQKKLDRMNQGGPGEARHNKILWWTWALGICQILFFLVALTLGIRRKYWSRLAIPYFIGSVLYLSVFTIMILAYQGYMSNPGETSFVPFPTPTTWMILGLGITPFYFAILYVIVFDRCIWTADDIEKFEQLLARQAEENRE